MLRVLLGVSFCDALNAVDANVRTINASDY